MLCSLNVSATYSVHPSDLYNVRWSSPIEPTHCIGYDPFLPCRPLLVMRLGEYRFAGSLPPHLAKHIIIRHPGYIRGEDSMLSLPRLDIIDPKDETDHGSTQVSGVHFGTVISACAIIAGNSFGRAFLSYDCQGKKKVHLSRNGILTCDHYYLHVPPEDGTDDTTSYPVTPSFQHWRFPEKIPSPWTSYASATQSRESCCIVSGSRLTDSAHIIPRAHETWWTNNAMGDYASGGRSVFTSKDNVFCLRVDLHRVLDNNAFALVPKADHQGWLHLAAHFFSVQDYGDAALEFHNQKAHSLDSVPLPFLFARFALTVFAHVKDFVLCGESRKIAVVQRGNDEHGRPVWKTQVANMDRAERQALFGQDGSQASSPSRRSRAGDDNEHEHNEYKDFEDYFGDDDYGDYNDDKNNNDLCGDNDNNANKADDNSYNVCGECDAYYAYDDYDDGFNSYEISSDERHRREEAQSRVRLWLSRNTTQGGGHGDEPRAAKRRRTSRAGSPPPRLRSNGDNRSDITTFCPFGLDLGGVPGSAPT